MDENQTAGQAPAATAQAKAPAAGKAGAKKPTPNHLATQMSTLQQAETIKQLQEQVRQLQKQSREAGAALFVTMTTLATSAFGLVAALAWNEAIKALFEEIFASEADKPATGLVISNFIYAVFATLIAVLIVYYLGRINTRLGKKPLLSSGEHSSE